MSDITYNKIEDSPFVLKQNSTSATGSNSNTSYWGTPMPLIAEDEATPPQVFGGTRLGEFISTIKRW